MPELLYIDTSGKTATVALSREGSLVAVRTHDDAREQAALLNGMIAEVLHVSGTTLDQVGAICVCAGPGSYTGLRVGLSTAKGLAYALDKPLLLFNNLDLLALMHQGTALDIALKAREGEYFFAQYDPEGQQTTAPQHLFAKDLADLRRQDALLITDDAMLAPAGTPSVLYAEHTVSMEHWIAAAEQRFAASQFDDLAYSEPFYLKAAYTTQSKK